MPDIKEVLPHIQNGGGRCLFSDVMCITRRFAMLSATLRVVNDHDQTPEIQPPLQRAIIIASVACFVSLIFVYWLGRPAIGLLEVRWAELLVYSIIPISVTFIILYRSCWHREITGAARTCVLLVLSGVILVGVLFAIGVMLCMAWFFWIAFSGGNHP
jgi:hypothetical protein